MVGLPHFCGYSIDYHPLHEANIGNNKTTKTDRIYLKDAGKKQRNHLYQIKNHILTDFRFLIWKDEIGDDFLILKWAEVFIYSDTELRLYVWSSKKYSQLKKTGQILWEDQSDDSFYTINVKMSYLPELLRGSGLKQRPHVHGKWIKGLESRLGHKIIRYEPELDNDLNTVDHKQNELLMSI